MAESFEPTPSNIAARYPHDSPDLYLLTRLAEAEKRAGSLERLIRLWLRDGFEPDEARGALHE